MEYFVCAVFIFLPSLIFFYSSFFLYDSISEAHRPMVS